MAQVERDAIRYWTGRRGEGTTRSWLATGHSVPRSMPNQVEIERDPRGYLSQLERGRLLPRDEWVPLIERPAYEARSSTWSRPWASSTWLSRARARGETAKSLARMVGGPASLMVRLVPTSDVVLPQHEKAYPRATRACAEPPAVFGEQAQAVQVGLGAGLNGAATASLANRRARRRQ